MKLNGLWRILGDLAGLGRLALLAGIALVMAWQSHVPTAYEHLEEFQAMADEHGDRAAGTSGHRAAAEYVERELERAGYETSRQYFTVETWDEEFETFSVLAETADGDPENVIMLGAHLDGVPDSPAINDNASGAAALLETAQRLAQEDEVTNKVRFAWWGAEEFRGLPGSTHYVEVLEHDHRLESIAAYLNFDMVASPNHIIGVYDARAAESGHGGHGGLGVPRGSEQVMEVFTDYFSAQGQEWVPTAWSLQSDHVPFAEAGVPVGGLFSGGGDEKTLDQARQFGGTAGRPRDPNYHQPGDDLGNVDRQVLEVMTDAITHAATRLAQDDSALD